MYIITLTRALPKSSFRCCPPAPGPPTPPNPPWPPPSPPLRPTPTPPPRPLNCWVHTHINTYAHACALTDLLIHTQHIFTFTHMPLDETTLYKSHTTRTYVHTHHMYTYTHSYHTHMHVHSIYIYTHRYMHRYTHTNMHPYMHRQMRNTVQICIFILPLYLCVCLYTQ